MQRIEPIIALIALVVATLVGFGVYHLVYTSSHKQSQAERCAKAIEMQDIMVASTIINTGDTIISSITYEKWPQSSLRSGLFLKNQHSAEQLKSLIARRIISQGEPISKSNVVDKKDRGVLSALINEGKRAISIGLDQHAGLAGLLNPGDIVDIIVALNNPEQGKEDDINRTILCGVRVLALDQHLSSSVEIVNKKASESTQPPKSVTLEVTPQQASNLVSAVKLGTISLTLHSTNDDKSKCVESSLKPIDQIKIVRGDGTQTSSPLKP